MSLARYLSKLGTLLNSSGQVTASGIQDAAVTAAKMASGAARTNFGAGAVLQVVQVTYDNVISASGGSFVDLPTLQANITPRDVNSKILVCPNFHVGASMNYQIMFRAYRVDSGVENWIGKGISDGIHTQCSFAVGQQAFDNYNLIQTSWMFLDAPASTNSLTYKFKWADPRDGGTHFIGRSYYDTNSAESRTTSLLTLLEIAG